jgi:hypothetical protein
MVLISKNFSHDDGSILVSTYKQAVVSACKGIHARCIGYGISATQHEYRHLDKLHDLQDFDHDGNLGQPQFMA